MKWFADDFHFANEKSLLTVSFISFHISNCMITSSPYKDSISRHGDFHDKYKMVLGPSYLYHGDPYTGKMVYLYWDAPFKSSHKLSFMSCNDVRCLLFKTYNIDLSFMYAWTVQAYAFWGCINICWLLFFSGWVMPCHIDQFGRCLGIISPLLRPKQLGSLCVTGTKELKEHTNHIWQHIFIMKWMLILEYTKYIYHIALTI